MLNPVPFPFYTYPYQTGNGFDHLNLTPFASIYGSITHFYYMVPLRNIGGNILLFMPLGFALPLRFQLYTQWKVILYGFLLSIVVETIQLFTSIRSFDVDDLILNTLGTALGFLIYRLYNTIRKSNKRLI